ncbi:Transmembrane protease serine 6, partial [Halocaridina rubra]
SVTCGQHQLEAGQVFRIRGLTKLCTWSFQAKTGGNVHMSCRKFLVPTSRRCRKASLQIASPGSATVSLCGRRTRLVVKREASSMTVTNKPKGRRRNLYDCEVYLRMPTNTTANCSCGTENSSAGTRIVGGTTSGLGQYPWMGGITFQGMKRFFCGVTLLTDSHGLTAAHCLHGKKMHKLIVVLAEHDISDNNDTPRTIRNIARIDFHPDYRPDRTNVGDLAVIKFDHPVPLHHKMVKPICLPPADAPDYAGRTAITAGWGYLQSGSENYAKELQAVEVPIWTNSDCKNTGFGNLIHKDLVCAGFPEGGADACTGDSGGPLSVVENGKHILVGTVSFGHYCAMPNWPGVYSRISGSLEWIQQTIESGVTCQN